MTKNVPNQYSSATDATFVLNGPSTSELVMLDGERDVSCGVHPNSSGTGYIESSLSSQDAVIAGTAVWTAWPAGEISESTVDVVIGPATALRAVCVSGSIIAEFKS